MAVICDVCGAQDIYTGRPPSDARRKGIVKHLVIQGMIAGSFKPLKIDLCMTCLDHVRMGEWAALADRAEHYD